MTRGISIFIFALVVVLCGGSSSAQTPTTPASDKKSASQDEKQDKNPTDQNAQSEKKRIVTLRAIIRSSGKAEDIEVVEVLPKDLPKEVSDDLVAKAVAALKSLKFQPPLKNGKPAWQYIKVEYYFDINQPNDKQKPPERKD